MARFRPRQTADELQDEGRHTAPWIRAVQVVVLMAVGVAAFVGLDWLLGEQLAIPNVRIGTVTGIIVWVLLSPLLLGRYR